MDKTLTAVFDGQVLRPDTPADLEPNTRYVVTVRKALPQPRRVMPGTCWTSTQGPSMLPSTGQRSTTTICTALPGGEAKPQRERRASPAGHRLSIDTPLLLRALELYRNRSDQAWGLTDCISFVVMGDHDLTVAVTSDAHFQQAGYRALPAEGE